MPTRDPDALRARLAAGETLLGFMAAIPAVSTVQLLAAAGADLVIVDMEHGPIDIGMAQAMVAAAAGLGTAPFVRVPWTEAWLAKPLLDCGAVGINFPMTRTADDARRAAEAVRYPPAGVRGFAPSIAPARAGQTAEDYIRTANERVLCMITIEDAEAVANLDEILAVPGIDIAAIASFDLSMSVGRPGAFGHPDVVGLTRTAEAKIAASGVALGGVALTAEAAKAKREAGYRVLLAGFDVLLVEGAARQALAAARS